MTQREEKKNWRSKNRPYIYAIVLAIVLTMFVAPEVMEGKSMEPSIEDGNILVCSKTSYSAKRGIPDIGQVVILEKTLAPDVSEDNIIGRVVGLPGEKIEIKSGKLYRDDKEYIVEGGHGDLGKDMSVALDKDHVFLLADNRSVVLDSRSKGLGPVEMREIKGNVLIVLWPFSNFGRVE